jgi:hypothetical protein
MSSSAAATSKRITVFKRGFKIRGHIGLGFEVICGGSTFSLRVLAFAIPSACGVTSISKM